MAQAQHRTMYGECKKTQQELMNDTRDYAVNGADKHKRMCQKLCQEELGKRVYLDQCVAIRAGRTKVTATRRRPSTYTQSTTLSMIYLAENATKFTAEEMCRNIIPAMLKPRA